MRALAHPARLAILEYLTAMRPEATATECASVVGLSPSATSYHLRALAKAGLIEEAPCRGDARERVWRARATSYYTDSSQDADARTRAAEEALLNTLLTRANERLRQWFARLPNEPQDWHAAAMVSHSVIIVTAQELAKLNAQIADLVRAYHRSRRTEIPPGARHVAVELRAFPIDPPHPHDSGDADLA